MSRMYARIAQQRRCCRTSPLDPSGQRTLQYIHRTVPIILDRLDLDLSPAHVGSGGGSEGQVLTVVVVWLNGVPRKGSSWVRRMFQRSGRRELSQQAGNLQRSVVAIGLTGDCGSDQSVSRTRREQST